MVAPFARVVFKVAQGEGVRWRTLELLGKDHATPR
jgi:hypothetical protein